MSDYNQYSASSRTDAVEFDAGLRAYMLKVYNYMAAGIGISGLVAWFASQSEALLQILYGGSIVSFAIMLAPLIMIFMFGRVMRTASGAGAQMFFWAFAALIGLSLSSIFLAYSIPSITRIFFVTTIMFSGLSAYGYMTKRDLSPIGAFLIMGLIGLLLMMVVNLFVGSGAIDFAVSVIGVLIFAGLTAFNTQGIKEGYYAVAGSGDMETKAAVGGALSLYLNFLNLFMFLLHLFGGSE